jgi:hypothetical protein
MAVSFKDKEYRKGLRAPILLGCIDCEPLFSKYGVDLVVTSGAEHFKHSAERSAHYRGDATDWRTKHLPTFVDKHKFVRQIKDILGEDYVVIFENEGKPQEHIHVHWSPIFRG